MPGFHTHDGAACDLVAGQDGGLYWRRTPPARQQRGVDVDAAVWGQVKHSGAQDLAEGCDDDNFRLQLGHRGYGFWGLEGGRLQDG
jgi:hypothetical protein